jgi:hypothetical protein
MTSRSARACGRRALALEKRLHVVVELQLLAHEPDVSHTLLGKSPAAVMTTSAAAVARSVGARKPAFLNARSEPLMRLACALSRAASDGIVVC